MSVHLIEEPEFRLAGAEEAIRQVVASIEQILQHHEPLARELAAKRLGGARPPAGGCWRREAGNRRPTLPAAEVAGAAAHLPEVAVPEPGAAAGVRGLPEPARPPVRRAARDQLLPRAPGRAATGCWTRRPTGAGAGGRGPAGWCLPSGCKDLARGGGRSSGRREAGGPAGAGRAGAGGDPAAVHRAGPRLPGQRQPAEERRGGDGGDRRGVRRRAAGRNQRGASCSWSSTPTRSEAKDEAAGLLRRGPPGAGARQAPRRDGDLRAGRAARPGRRPLPRADAQPPCPTWSLRRPPATTTSCSTAKSPTCRWPSWNSSAPPASTPTAR